jgi:hypothetical protein
MIMPFLSKFQQHDFQNGFQTHNSVLDTVPYEPEVIFIGTLNHGWSWNNSDFFYGRGMYMWTVLGNLFIHNSNHLVSPRTANNVQPTLQQLFEICRKGKIVFANIVKGLKPEIQTIENIQERYVLVNNEFKWCSGEINGKRIGGYADSHIENMAKHGWLDDNVDAIMKYINKTTSIKHIYFTFKSGLWLVEKLNAICNGVRRDVSYCSIFTPTAKGFGELLEPPFNTRAWGLTHCWIWNGLGHHFPVIKPGYGHLNHDWLIDNGVNPDNF